MSNIIDTIMAIIGVKNPILSAFIVSLVSNAIPYMTVPYLGIIAGWGLYLHNDAEKVLVAVSGGIGAALGKVIVFLLGRSFRRILPENTRQNVEIFAKAFKKSVFFALFLFAALPLPDDVLYVPLGVTGYNLLLFFIAVALGKIVITFLAVVFGDLIRSITGSEGLSPEALAALIIGSIVVAIIIIRINWLKIIETYNEKGVMPALVELIKQTILAMLPKRVVEYLSEKIGSP